MVRCAQWQLDIRALWDLDGDVGPDSFHFRAHTLTWLGEPCRSRWGKLFIVVMGVVGHLAGAQEPPIVVNPNRPTFATPALTTQFSVAELEFGPQQSFLRGANTAFSTPTLLKLGLEKDFELRLSTNGLLHLTYTGESSTTGFADFALGAQWCFSHQGLFGADWAVQLTHKFATASAQRGLGSGAADTTLGLFWSRDFGPNHMDINFLHTWLGLPTANGGGSVHQPAGTVSVSHKLNDTWSFGGEVYGIGGTALNGRVVSNLWYVAYQPSSRLALDSGVDVGLSHGAQRYSIFAGLTWGVGRFRKP